MRKHRAACLRVLLALTVLSGCGNSGHSSKPSATPTAAASWKFTTLNLGIPDKALKAPVTGWVPDGKMLHVGVTLKVSDDVWKKYGHGKSPAQAAGDVGKELGVSDQTIQKVQAYLNNAHIQAKTSRTRTSVTFDVQAGQAAKLLRTSFATHRLNGRTYFTPDPNHPPQIPEQLAPYILAVTGLESYSAAPKARGALGAALPERALPTRAARCIQRFPQRIASSQKVATAYGYNQLWNQGWHGENMTVFISSGDCGAYGDRVYGTLDVSFPSTSPYVVAVGGTRLDFAPNGARTQEVVWSDRSNVSRCENQWGSGGGVSRFHLRESFQQAPGVDSRYSAGGGRQVPDVSAAAINLPIYYRGRWVSSGGTSAAAPIWAAGMALVNQGLLTRSHIFCFGPDTFYHALSAAGGNKPYTDVVAGNNLYYPATAGFDLSTGLGSPNLPAFFNTLVVNPG